MLQLGSRGSAVVALQKKLGIPADGIFGPQTLAAVKSFQSRNGLAADGIVGPKTQAKLGSAGSSGGGGGVKNPTSPGTATPPDWSQTPEGRAAMFGWSKAVIDSNPELKKIFAQASKENWTSDHFVAKVRDTTWFKTHSDTFRQGAILKKADPATYAQRVAQARAQIATMAHQMGALVPGANMAHFSDQAVMFGWTTDQIKQVIGAYVKAGANGQWTGDAAGYSTQYQKMMADYNVAVSPTTLAKWIHDSVTGTANPDQVRNAMMARAMSKYPSLAEQLKAGQTVRDIAAPYLQSYATTLEVNPNTISVNDPMVQQALAYKDPKTNQPTQKTIWQFEQDLRNDPRYMKTQQAQDTAMKMTKQVLQDWGVVG